MLAAGRQCAAATARGTSQLPDPNLATPPAGRRKGPVARHLLCSRVPMRRTQVADARSSDMPMNIDQYVGVHAAALDVRARRGELIANNLANADTPGLPGPRHRFPPGPGARLGRRRPRASRCQTTQAGHIGGATSADAATNPDLKYRTPLAPALDGNTVDAQIEQAAFAENAVRYQATLTFLNSKFRGLLTAIIGSEE